MPPLDARVPHRHCCVASVLVGCQTYYVHEETGETRWDKPSAEGVKFLARKVVAAGGVGVAGSAEDAAAAKAALKARAAQTMNLPRVDTAASNVRRRRLRSRGFSKRGLSVDGDTVDGSEWTAQDGRTTAGLSSAASNGSAGLGATWGKYNPQIVFGGVPSAASLAPSGASTMR